MKAISKIAFAAAALLSVLPASADVHKVGNAIGGDPYLLPSQFTFDKKTQLVIEDGDDDTYAYTIFDAKFNQIAKITTPQYGYDVYPTEIDICSEYSPVDAGELIITQTLFNNDELYEWVIPVYGENGCKGFKVMSQSGAVVANVAYPAEYCYVNYLELELYLLGEDTYLLAEVQDEDGEYYVIPYAVSAGEASVSQVAAPHRVSVRPATPRRGTSVIVSIPEEFNGATVNVVSASGAVVMTKTIAAGQTSTDINTGTLPAGVYVVSVTDGEAAHEAAKIVVR